MSTPVPDTSNWQARLELDFQARADKTVLAGRRHQGPLVVQRPFYPEGATCHTYILHPPGGVVGGDELEIQVRLRREAQALLTTPASGKFYRSAGALAQQRLHIQVDEGAQLEWLPQDNILFPGCRVDLHSCIDLAADARCILWDMLCLGRPAADEVFGYGECRQRLEIRKQGKPLWTESLRLQGGDDFLAGRWGLGNHSVLGVLLAYPAPAEDLPELQALCEQAAGKLSVTRVGEVTVCRYLGDRGDEARHWFEQLWLRLRPGVLQRPAVPPRIWRT